MGSLCETTSRVVWMRLWELTVGCLNNKPGGTGTMSENRGLGRVMPMSPGAGHLDSKAAPVKSYHSKSRLSGTKQLV